MILEGIDFLFHSFLAPKYLVKLGMLQEIIAIKYRNKRLESYWLKHRENSKREILKQTAKLKSKKKALILGAGLLLDIPIKELAGEFEEVILVDIFFLQEIINETRYFNNLRFEQVDISSVLKEAYYLWVNYGQDKKKFDDKIRNLSYRKPNHFLLEENIDYVLSCNILSQLAMAFENFAEKKKFEKTKNYDEFVKGFSENHIEYLKNFSKNSFVHLITDTQKLVYNKNKTLVGKENSFELELLKDFKKEQDWIWDLADYGEIEKDYALKLQVDSFVFERK